MSSIFFTMHGDKIWESYSREILLFDGNLCSFEGNLSFRWIFRSFPSRNFYKFVKIHILGTILTIFQGNFTFFSSLVSHSRFLFIFLYHLKTCRLLVLPCKIPVVFSKFSTFKAISQICEPIPGMLIPNLVTKLNHFEIVENAVTLFDLSSAHV